MHPEVYVTLGIWAKARMRPLSYKSPAPTDRRLQGVVVRMSLGGLFQEQLEVTASSHRVRSPPHKQMSPLNSWTWGVRELFHRVDESTDQCGVERERRPQRKSVRWGQDGMFTTLV